jgi:hypothetical protein
MFLLPIFVCQVKTNELEAFADAISTKINRLIHRLFPVSPQSYAQYNVLDLTAKHIILCLWYKNLNSIVKKYFNYRICKE